MEYGRLALAEAGRLRVVRITAVRQETPRDITLEFRDSAPMAPGQFYMIWLPNGEEVPMSSSLIGPRSERAVTARRQGETTEKMYAAKKGDILGVRGPFGKGFSMKWKRPLFVGGGVGAASIITAVEAFKGRAKPTVIIGARTKAELIYERRLRRRGVDLRLATDDGSKGFHGTVVQLAANLMDERRYSHVITCGPERMLVALLAEATRRRVKVEAALERHMKCAMGVCDVCAIDGLRVCRQGPVFDEKFMRSSRQFGREGVDASGHLHPI